MKLLLIGDFSNDYDEGLKNIAKNFYRELSGDHEINTINVKHIASFQAISAFFGRKPDIIHYFTAPTLESFALLKGLAIRWPSSRRIVSALHPGSDPRLRGARIQSLVKKLVRFDLLLYQERPGFLERISSRQIFFPNGVNTTKFRPTDARQKVELRRKYGIDPDKTVFLHVGHLTSRRNLEILNTIQQMDDNFQVIVVAGTYLQEDPGILSSLRSHGCHVIVGYQERIEEIYGLSDCYIFPVLPGDSISMPLSILEAMACDLPVISIRYPSLSGITGGCGLYLVDKPGDIPVKIMDIRGDLENGKGSRKEMDISAYSWKNLSSRLSEIYSEMLSV